MPKRFNLGPARPLPVSDSCLVTLQRLAGRSLARPVELAQDAPDVVLVVSHAGAGGDELAHSARGPQPGDEAERFRAALERARDRATAPG
jgi:hypothetical protein